MRLPLTVLLCLAAGQAVSADDDLPPVVCEGTSQVVILYPGETGTAVIPFTVPAGDPFLVRTVTKSCGCFLVGPLPADFPAGTPSTLGVRVDSGTLRGAIGGEVVVLGSRGGKPASVRGTIRAEVKDLLRLPEDRPIDLGAWNGADLPHEVAFTWAHGDHPLAWDGLALAVEGGDGIVSARAEAQPDGAWRIVLGLAPTSLRGHMGARLAFTFSDHGAVLPYHPGRRLRFEIPGAVTAVPGGVLFGAVAPGSVSERDVKLVSTAAEPGVRSITCSDPRVQATRTEGTMALHVRLAADRTPGPASSHVDVGLADGTILRIPIYAAISPPR